jgi:uncharacterized protein (TIGR03905 family)
MAKYTYKTKGTCSSRILFEIEDGIVKNVSFQDGCNGNLQGVAKLVDGRQATEVIETLKGIKCGSKPTSCPDQLASALELAILQPVR